MDKSLKTNGDLTSLKTEYAKEGKAMGMNWREWKKMKKEQRMKWQEEKLLKKQLKAKNKKESENVEQDFVPKNKWYTVSIAVPGSIMDNVQTPNLKAHLVAHIARSAAIMRVNEIIVYSDSNLDRFEDTEESLKLHAKNRGCTHMVRILQYLECPPYLRKNFFPIHNDLEHAGEVHPLQIPSHLGIDDESEYREGIVINKPVKPGRGSFVNIGLRKPAVIDKLLKEYVRVTVKLDKEQNSKKHYRGKAVAPTAPLKHSNIYWGYNVRLAKSLPAVFSECPYDGGYDVTIGTSDKGDDGDSVEVPSFNHLLVVFGGLKGIEACLEDETITATDPRQLFNVYLNAVPDQGTRTIRTEEAILLTLQLLRPKICKAQKI